MFAWIRNQADDLVMCAKVFVAAGPILAFAVGMGAWEFFHPRSEIVIDERVDVDNAAMIGRGTARYSQGTTEREGLEFREWSRHTAAVSAWKARGWGAFWRGYAAVMCACLAAWIALLQLTDRQRTGWTFLLRVLSGSFAVTWIVYCAWGLRSG